MKMNNREALYAMIPRSIFDLVRIYTDSSFINFSMALKERRGETEGIPISP